MSDYSDKKAGLRLLDSAFDAGLRAYEEGRCRDGGGFLARITPTDDPWDADHAQLVGWLSGWDAGEIMAAYRDGFDCGLKNTTSICPVDIIDDEPRRAWIEAWISAAALEANGFPVEH